MYLESDEISKECRLYFSIILDLILLILLLLGILFLGWILYSVFINFSIYLHSCTEIGGKFGLNQIIQKPKREGLINLPVFLNQQLSLVSTFKYSLFLSGYKVLYISLISGLSHDVYPQGIDCLEWELVLFFSGEWRSIDICTKTLLAIIIDFSLGQKPLKLAFGIYSWYFLISGSVFLISFPSRP